MSKGKPTRGNSRQRWASLLLILCAFGLRAFQLGSQSLWYDEGVTARLAQMNIGQAVEWTANDIQPPLYYSIELFWGRLAGWSEFSLRFPSLFFGVLTIPLLWVLVRIWSPQRLAAMLAAAIATLHPLLIYYSQEARMYAMLLALGVACAGLISAALNRPVKHRLWVIYVVLGTAALYTHYFAFFLLAAFALAFLIERRFSAAVKPALRPFVFANTAILVLYLPWIGAMIERLAVDSSYWQGELKVLEALRHVAISFATGETVLERQAIWLTGALCVVSIIVIVAAWLRAEIVRPALRFGAIWLMTPLVGVMLLASFAPKFNARYVMIAVPGLILLWSIASARLLSDSARSLRVCVAALFLLMTVAFTLANVNWFFNDAFAKAQWRQLVEFLRPRLAEDETVILVSGHAWPVWDYYAPDIPPLRLPEIDVLDVNSLLTFENSAEPLKALLEEKPGAWLVSWQEEVVDPNEIVPTQLELGGREKASSAVFSQLSLRRFSRIRTSRIAKEPPIQVTLDAPFGDQLALVGYRGLDNGDLLLFWQRRAGAATDKPAAQDDYHMALEVFDELGRPVATVPDRRLAGYTYPSFRWQPGEIVMGRIPASEWLGDDPVPGRYTVHLAVYDMADPTLTRLITKDGLDELVIPSVEAIIE